MSALFVPDEVFHQVFAFLPHPYRVPSHFLALKHDDIYACFKIRIHFFYTHHAPSDWDANNGFFAYKRWFILKRRRITGKN